MRARPACAGVGVGPAWPRPVPPPPPPSRDTAAAAAGAGSSSRPATPPPPPPAPPRPNRGLRAGAESAPGGEYATLPQPPSLLFDDPATTQGKTPDSAARPLPSPSCWTQRCPGPRDLLVPRAAPNPTPSRARCEPCDPCQGSRCAPPSVPTPPEILRGGTPTTPEPLFSLLPGPGAPPLRGPPGFQLRPVNPPPLWGTCRRRRPRPRVLYSRVSKSDGLGFFYIFSCSRGQVPPRPIPGQGFELGEGQVSRVLARGRPLPPAGLGTGRRLGRRLAPGACVLSLRPTQCSSFMSRPGLRWRVRWRRESARNREWGKGPAGRRRALSLPAFLTT